MNFLEAEISQIYLNLTEISEDRQGSLFVMKTRWKTFKIGIHSYSNKANGVTSDRDFFIHIAFSALVYGILLFF